MTTEKHDPWALLAEIHELQPWLSQDADLAARVEAALAERQDSAKDVVEWKRYGTKGYTARVNGADLTVRDLGKPYGSYRDEYSWHISLWGDAPTEAEARRAATAAARRLK
jgi:hypothetical protein